jgi:hypothetical protein
VGRPGQHGPSLNGRDVIDIGCGCGGGSSAKFDYQVQLRDGTTQTVSSKQEARILISAAGGGTYKAVPKSA